MTRADFVALAITIERLDLMPQDKRIVAEAIAAFCAAQNDRFNHAKFHAVAGTWCNADGPVKAA